MDDCDYYFRNVYLKLKLFMRLTEIGHNNPPRELALIWLNNLNVWSKTNNVFIFMLWVLVTRAGNCMHVSQLISTRHTGELYAVPIFQKLYQLLTIHNIKMINYFKNLDFM